MKVKFVLGMIATAILGFVIGMFCGYPPTTGKAAGDVKRAKVFTKNIVEIDADHLQEQLQSDSAYCAAMKIRALQMQAQAHTLVDLIDKSNEELADNEYFASTVSSLNSMKNTALNACNAIDLLVENLTKLAEGEKVEGFEQVYNNAILSCYMIDGQVSFADSFSNDMVTYLAEGNTDDAESVKDLFYGWTSYSLSSAVIAGNAANAERIMEVFHDQADELGLRANQEQLNRFKNLNQEQLNTTRYPNQEQLNQFCITNQELLNMNNEEQLNAIVVSNQELLNMRNQEQLSNALEANQQLNLSGKLYPNRY